MLHNKYVSEFSPPPMVNFSNDDIEEFANLGWLNGRVLDMVVNEESDSEPLA